MPFHWKDIPRLLPRLMRVIRKVKPDLVQAGPLQTSALLVALSGYRPLVSMSWGYDLLIDAQRNALWRWATRFALSHSAALVGDCETIRQKAMTFGMPAKRIVTFPWGVDIQRYSPDKRQPGSMVQVFTLLSTRSWEPLYGVDVLAQAFVQAALECSDLHLLMLGNGSLAARLRQVFLQAGVQEQVSFPGQVSQQDLPRYYRLADVYLSASHSDGTSISMLEAMACGRPVLVSDIPGNREWVNAGENGWLFRDGDAASLSQAILEAVEQRARLPEMGRKARALVEQRGDWERNFPKLFEAYDLALS